MASVLVLVRLNRTSIGAPESRLTEVTSRRSGTDVLSFGLAGCWPVVDPRIWSSARRAVVVVGPEPFGAESLGVDVVGPTEAGDPHDTVEPTSLFASAFFGEEVEQALALNTTPPPHRLRGAGGTSWQSCCGS